MAEKENEKPDKNKNQLYLLKEILQKLNLLTSLVLRILVDDRQFIRKGRAKKGTNELVMFLSGFGLDAHDISEILSVPLQSVRTLLTPKRREK